MQVVLISYTPDPELTAAEAASGSTSPVNITELFERIKKEAQKVAPLIGAELNPKCYRPGCCDERESCSLFPLRNLSGEKMAGKVKT